MKIVSIDLSSKTGVAYFDSKQPSVLINIFDFELNSGTPISQNRAKKIPDEMLRRKKKNRVRTPERYDPINHPHDFLSFVDDYIDQLISEIRARDWWIGLDYLVLEQTNKGRDRWKQKLLEWLHYDLCKKMGYKDFKIAYIDTIEWRRILEIRVSKTQRKANKMIRKHNKEAKENPEIKRIVGITDTKDVAIEFCENHFNLNMKKKDNNIADAICLGYAFLKKQGEI